MDGKIFLSIMKELHRGSCLQTNQPLLAPALWAIFQNIMLNSKIFSKQLNSATFSTKRNFNFCQCHYEQFSVYSERTCLRGNFTNIYMLKSKMSSKQLNPATFSAKCSFNFYPCIYNWINEPAGLWLDLQQLRSSLIGHVGLLTYLALKYRINSLSVLIIHVSYFTGVKKLLRFIQIWREVFKCR